MSNPIFVASADAKKLAGLMVKVSVGATLTYEDMSEALGRDVLQDRSIIATARAIVQRENQFVFDTVYKVGIKRLNDVEIVSLGDQALSKVRRISRKTSQKITCVAYDAMPREAQVRHNTALSMFGVLVELASSKSFTKLEKHVAAVGTELPIGKASIAALGLIFS